MSSPCGGIGLGVRASVKTRFRWPRDSTAAEPVDVALENLTGHTIGDRPGRAEPRAVKRRPKPHALLTKPRAQARAELLEVESS